MKLASGALASGFTARALHRDQEQMAKDSVYSSPQYFTVKAQVGGGLCFSVTVFIFLWLENEILVPKEYDVS